MPTFKEPSAYGKLTTFFLPITDQRISTAASPRRTGWEKRHAAALRESAGVDLFQDFGSQVGVRAVRPLVSADGQRQPLHSVPLFDRRRYLREFGPETLDG